jgi:glycine cleavage system aminomethyltransferase T
MAMVGADFAEIGTSVSVDIRGTKALYKVVKLPFYKRPNN